ncbi:MAG: tRNA (adenosine(37)-N6)-dimethylallyltransferase MiaA [Chloroflexi bacterium]|nr:tRNA (adenosine(37)-N6)-dimethylallyltransferase MiaA [Chloroflexota bacterium]
MTSETVKKLLLIVGPTAAGKTALAVDLARQFPLEVVSADSRQIYRGMDIGTAKPTAAEQSAVPHHLLDVVDPNQTLTLAEYQRLATAAISEVQDRGNLPALVGGTGLYVRAVTAGFQIPEVEPDQTRRQVLEQEAESLGTEALYQRLVQVDPVAASRIDSRNLRRIIRALEVVESTGQPFSAQQVHHPPPWEMLWIGLTLPKAELDRRIEARVDRMIAAGLVEEVQRLLAEGVSPAQPALSGLGYRQIVAYLQGRLTLEEAILLIKRDTRRFARRQYAWFRLSDPKIHWFEARLDDGAPAGLPGSPRPAIIDLVASFWEERPV